MTNNPGWEISKSFSFCYGHRVWTQVLNEEFVDKRESGGTKCRHLHGHEAEVVVYLRSENNQLNKQGMVTDFKHLGWLKVFFDQYIDHRFIIDVHDPWFVNIVNGIPTVEERDGKPYVTALKPRLPLATGNVDYLNVNPVKEGDITTGFMVNTDCISGCEKEFYDSFFIVDFVPTSENLSAWVYNIAQEKFKKLDEDNGVYVSKVIWKETPKSMSTFGL